MTANDTLTRIPGIKVGHVTDVAKATGCTVILCPPGTVGAVDVRGGAPGTRETDLLAAHNLVSEVTAVVLSGGSAFGLATADGVMRWHTERGMGYQSRSGVTVPIVPAAILFDLTIGEAGAYPDADFGYRACQSATDAPVGMGSVGAGTGARIAAILGSERASKGGIGSALAELPGGLLVGALMAVNAVGNIIARDGKILAGLRAADGDGFDSVLETMSAMAESQLDSRENTVIGVVVTNGDLNKAQAAQGGADGAGRHRARGQPGAYALRWRYHLRAGDWRNSRRPDPGWRIRRGDGRGSHPPRRHSCHFFGWRPRHLRLATLNRLVA